MCIGDRLLELIAIRLAESTPDRCLPGSYRVIAPFDARIQTTILPTAMPYPEALVSPMRAELTRLGVKELTTAAEVDQAFAKAVGKTTLLVVNSVCGCAAANARPAVAMALQSEAVKPDDLITVFAGQDLEATNQARTHLAGIPPSSPFIALFKDGEPVFALERRHIEGRSASAIAADLVNAFAEHCGDTGSPRVDAVSPAPEDADGGNSLPDTFRSIL